MENTINEALDEVRKDQSSIIKAVHTTSEIQTELNNEEDVSSIIAFIENSISTYAMEEDVDKNYIIKKCALHQKEERAVSNEIVSPKSNDYPIQKNNDKHSVLITKKMESIAKKKDHDESKCTIMQEKDTYDKEEKNLLFERGKEKVPKEYHERKKNASKEDSKTDKHKHMSKDSSTKSTHDFHQKKPNELKYRGKNNSKRKHDNVGCMQPVRNKHSELKGISLGINKMNDIEPSKSCSKVEFTASLSIKHERISPKSNNLSNRDVNGNNPDSRKNIREISSNKHKCVHGKEENKHVIAKKPKTENQSNSSQRRSKKHQSSSVKNKFVQNEKKSVSRTINEKSDLNSDERLKMNPQVLIPQLTSHNAPELSKQSQCNLILDLEDDNNIISSNHSEQATSTAERELSSRNVSRKRKDKTNEKDIQMQSSVLHTIQSYPKTDMLFKKPKLEISNNPIKQLNSVMQSSIKQNTNSNRKSHNSNDKITINSMPKGNILQSSNVPIKDTLINNDRNDLILNKNQNFQPVQSMDRIDKRNNNVKHTKSEYLRNSNNQEYTVVEPTMKHITVPTVPMYKSKTTHCHSTNENSEADNNNKLNVILPKVERQKNTDNKQCEQSSTENGSINASSTDSDETLSNVESVPNSPCRHSQSGTATENGTTESNSPKNDETSNVTNTDYRDISENYTTFRKRIDTARKNSRSYHDEIDSNLGSNTNRNDVPQYYIDIEKPPDNPLEHVKSIVTKGTTNATAKYNENELVKTSTEEPLKHYKKPHGVDKAVHIGNSSITKKSHKKCTTDKKVLTRNKVSIVKDSRNEKYLRNRNKKHLNIRKHISLKVKRSRKKSLQDVHSNSEYSSGTWRTKKDTGLPKSHNQLETQSVETHMIENGHALTLDELDILYAKFLRDGHFRADPNLPPFILSKNDKNNYLTISMRCYDPRERGISAMNLSKGPNGEINSNAQLNKNLNYNSGNGNTQFSTVERNSNSQSSMEKPLYSLTMDVNFTEPISNTFVDLTTNESIGKVSDMTSNAPQYTKNETVTGCSNIHNKSDSNSFVSSNTMQSNDNKMALNSMRYTSNTDNSNYNSSCYQTGKYVSTNRTNFTNPSCSNLNTVHSNHESFMNFTNDNPLLSNNTSQTSTMTAVPSFQNSPINNEWNTLPSTGSEIFNESSISNFRTNASTINYANQGMNVPSPMTSNGSSSLNGTNNSFAMTNSQNPLINRNNFSNSGYMVLPPWNNTQCTPYLNTTRPYYNNMYNPFNPNYVGFDVPNVPMLNNQNYMGNNTNAWSQNRFPFTNNGNSVSLGSAFNNSEAFDVNSFPLQENTTSSVQSTQLPSIRTILSQTNTFSESSNNVLSDYRMNEETILPEVTKFQQSNGIHDNSAHSRANLYNNNDSNEETYMTRYKYDVQNTEFHNTKLVKHTGDDNNYQQIHNNLNQKMEFESEHSCHTRLKRPGSPDCVIIAELSTREPTLPEATTKKSDIHQLRRELADFTKQYTVNQPVDSTSKPF